MKDAEFAIKNEARQKKMQEERAVKIAKEEKEREEKEAFDAYVEAVAAQNKDYDLQFNKLYVGGNVSDNKWRPPANALRVSRMLGITATSKKAMKKVSKAWAKREKKNKKKKPKKLTEKQKKKAAKKKAKEEAKAKEAADKKAARRKKISRELREALGSVSSRAATRSLRFDAADRLHRPATAIVLFEDGSALG